MILKNSHESSISKFAQKNPKIHLLSKMKKKFFHLDKRIDLKNFSGNFIY